MLVREYELPVTKWTRSGDLRYSMGTIPYILVLTRELISHVLTAKRNGNYVTGY